MQTLIVERCWDTRVNRYRYSTSQFISMYHEHLADMVEAEEKGYILLINTLARTPFEWSVIGDDNRMYDGLNLRDSFELMHNMPLETIPGQCSILEMMIALAMRVVDIADLESIPTAVDWFWEMAHNLDLTYFSDDEFYVLDGTNAIDIILKRFINRTYEYDGQGGLFPLTILGKDQRKVEIWYQFHYYLEELENRGA